MDALLEATSTINSGRTRDALPLRTDSYVPQGGSIINAPSGCGSLVSPRIVVALSAGLVPGVAISIIAEPRHNQGVMHPMSPHESGDGTITTPPMSFRTKRWRHSFVAAKGGLYQNDLPLPMAGVPVFTSAVCDKAAIRPFPLFRLPDISGYG